MSEILQAIARVRRAMPRNADVMRICDELEWRLVDKVVDKPKVVNKVDKPVVDMVDRKSKRVRTDYMRVYQRKRRAGK